MDKTAQLHDRDGPLFVCRMCTLSGELHLGHEGSFCEVCRDHEPLTVEIIDKLAARLQPPHTVAAPIAGHHGPASTCSVELRLAGKGYPKTCAECGLGPCKKGLR